MNIQDVIGELLYIGIVAEKGRCYEKGWRFGYKRIIYKHVAALKEKCMICYVHCIIFQGYIWGRIKKHCAD